jgi:hypothetical protein
MPFANRIRAAARSAAVAATSLVALTARAEGPGTPETQTASPPSATAQSSAAADTKYPTNTFAALSTADLEERGITGLDGIAAAVPGISYSPALNSLSTLSLYMRGEGQCAT